jgi:hypothetical protein
MGRKCKVSPFDKLPDKLVIKIFGFLMREKEDMSSLLQTCKRFCRIIDSNLLTQPDSVEYGWDWDENPPCNLCVRIFAVSNFKFAKRNTIFINSPLKRCCFNTFKALESNFSTITSLVSSEVIDFATLSRLLAILGNVHRLRLVCFKEGAVHSIQTAKLFDRTLSYLEIDGQSLPERSALLNFPARDIRVRDLNHYNVSWFINYLFGYKQIIDHARVNIFGERESSSFIEELSGTMKSLGFSVKIRPDYEGSIALEGFKTLPA